MPQGTRRLPSLQSRPFLGVKEELLPCARRVARYEGFREDFFFLTLWSSQLSRADRHACRPHVHAHTRCTNQVGKGRSCGKSPVGGAGRLPRQVRAILLELGT